MSTATVKSTININKSCKEQLEYLVHISEIKSFTEGVNLAIEQFVKDKQKELYAKEMEKAKSDEEFIKRTIVTHKEFEKTDLEMEKLISVEDYEW